MQDEPLRITPTHAAAESEGRVFGLDLARIKWVLLALFAGLLPGWLLAAAIGFVWAALVIFGPALVVAAFQLFFLQDRPEGWFSQWVETRLTGGHLSPLRHR